MESAFALLGCM